MATTLIESLAQRDWSRDPELIVELEHARDGTTSELVVLGVALDKLGEALDQSPASVSYIDLADATVWPGATDLLGRRSLSARLLVVQEDREAVEDRAELRRHHRTLRG